MRLTTLKPGDKFDISKERGLLTASGAGVAKTLDEFLDYYEKAKLGAKPECMRISMSQVNSMQWSPAAKKNGDRSEPRTLDLYFKDIPVKVGAAT